MTIAIKMFAALTLGALMWTLTEYLLHRFLGHVPKKYLLRTRFYKEHAKHHYIKNYFAKAVDKFLTVLATGPVAFFAAQYFIGSLYAVTFTFGFLAMYLYYELIHRRLHAVPPMHAFASHMRAHHFYHHFMDESMNHGVSTPIWDYVFGTKVKPGDIRVPRNLGPVWIKSNQGGEFKDPWGKVYLDAVG